MSHYTPEARKIFKTLKPPFPRFVVDAIEYPDYLALRVYKDNIESFSDPQKVALAEYLYQVRDAIRSLGINCHIEGVLHDPPSQPIGKRVRLLHD